MLYRSESMKSRRQALSNILLLCFILAIVLAGAFSEFFQTPRQANDNPESWRQLFTRQQLAETVELELTNKLGVFRFKKENKPDGEGWNMIHPRNLKADEKTIAKIFDGIQQIKVLRIYPQDPINLSHYSLDTPATVLKLTNALKQTLVLKTGLVNPIDNSTYITLSKKEPLFHIEKLNFPMESLNIANFIDSSIFSLPLKEISQIQIFRGSRLNLSAHLQNGRWVNKKDNPFDENKIQAFLKKMFSLRSLLILDEITQQLQKEINRHAARPLYIVTIRDKQNRTHTYKITPPLSKLSNVKMEKGQNSMVISSDGSHPQLMDKEHLNVFNIKENGLH